MLFAQQQVADFVSHCVTHQSSGRDPKLASLLADLGRKERGVANIDDGRAKGVAYFARLPEMCRNNPDHQRAPREIAVAQLWTGTVEMSDAMEPASLDLGARQQQGAECLDFVDRTFRPSRIIKNQDCQRLPDAWCFLAASADRRSEAANCRQREGHD